jgi:hypothetical protein
MSNTLRNLTQLKQPVFPIVIEEEDVVVASGVININFENASVVDNGDNKVTVICSGGGGGSGTVETIVAGDNITVDSSDPANPIVAVSGLPVPGGANTQIQYNDSGSFGGDANLTWNKGTKILTLESLIDIDKHGFYSYHTGNPIVLFGDSLIQHGFYDAGGAQIEFGTGTAIAGLKLRSVGDYFAVLDTSALTANREFDFPNAAGTLAITTDIPTIPTTTAENDFQVGNATPGTWIKKTLAETKTILRVPFVSNDAPANPQNGDLWWDTNDDTPMAVAGTIQSHIVNADGTLASATATINALLAALESYGIIAPS